MRTRRKPKDPPNRTLSDIFVQVVSGVLAGLLLALILGVFGVIPLPWRHDDSSPSPQSTASSPSLSTAVDIQKVRRFSLICKEVRPLMHPGDQVQMVYNIELESAGDVGIGADLYAENGDQYSTGDDDDDSFFVEPGGSRKTRSFIIPPWTPPGKNYELVGEIWPADKIGKGEILKRGDESCPERIEIADGGS